MALLLKAPPPEDVHVSNKSKLEGMKRSRTEQLQAEVPEDVCDARVDIKYYLRNACFILRKAEAYHRDGDLEWEYRCLWRFACLLADVLPQHPMYRKKHVKLTNELRQHARLAIDRLDAVAQQINGSSADLFVSAESPGPPSVPYDPFAHDVSVLQLAGVQRHEQQGVAESGGQAREHRLPDGRVDLLTSDVVDSSHPAASSVQDSDDASTNLNEKKGSSTYEPNHDGISAHAELEPAYHRIDSQIREKHSLGLPLPSDRQSLGQSPSAAVPKVREQDHTMQNQTRTEGLQDGLPVDSVHRAHHGTNEEQKSFLHSNATVSPHRELDVPPQEVAVSQPHPPAFGEDSCECGMPSMSMNERKALEAQLCNERSAVKDASSLFEAATSSAQTDVMPRSLHVSTHLMDTFMRIAEDNTRKNLETCAILAGEMRKGVFLVTTLIVPKQTATSNSVTATNEEEIFDEQDSRQLFSLGWIHTHPRQACFLSSIDLHTHCAYQTMLEEAVAIVMAPTDQRQKYGIFQLTTPEGLRMIQQCTKDGFHPHDEPGNGKPIYEHSRHVYFNASVGCNVLDLR